MTDKQAWAVIGANFGDCGKGVTTDYLCSKAEGPVTVIRFNGGAQAGHTVQTPTGCRHVFHHFGSGAFLNARTHLGKRFICNPIVFQEERKRLVTQGLSVSRLSADPQCIVSTPWDMMMNCAVETKRGLKMRHGSCGMGINETVTRNAESTYGFTLDFAKEGVGLKDRLRGIQHEYVPYRLEQLGTSMSELSTQEREHMLSEDILTQYAEDLKKFLVYAQLLPLEKLTDKHIVFEGAQGLGLDEHRGGFPFVTRSSTGLQNVMDLCPELGIDELKTVYVTRPYITRHGEGLLQHELPDKPWSSVVDVTNVPNPWQGMIRYGSMDEGALIDRITLDLADARYKVQGAVDIQPTVMLTCVDQIPGGLDKGIFPVRIGLKRTVPEFLSHVRTAIGSSPNVPCFVSNGPTREDVLPLLYPASVPLEEEA